MLFSVITLLTVIVSFAIFIAMAKMFGGKEIVIPKLPKIEKKYKPTKEEIKNKQRQEDIKFNIDNFHGINSPEREIK